MGNGGSRRNDPYPRKEKNVITLHHHYDDHRIGKDKKKFSISILWADDSKNVIFGIRST
ncbi:Uncharacterized protein APZ42_020964 [Daphnia magna]|uniref:Uncharacterized protein n=1 Tax=Daphnia magna TaxID=35525 RepID=A0A164X317_9CRUS|nr:Uncharacterized protein APZ42_020964 [Daphnia magna]